MGGPINAQAIRFTPRGLVDAYDATDKFPGACRALSNLVFDSVNPEFVVNRPGTLTLANFVAGGFSNPTFISIQLAIGSYIFGMVATSRNAGNDEPFMYNTLTGSFVTISGVTAGNTPASPSTAGDWTPPTLTNVGTMIVITHPGFNGTGSNFYGIIDLTNIASPAWRDENTATNPLTGVPIAVANFNNRAWFAVGNQVEYTDVLTNPLTRSNATQALVVGDNEAINALSGLPAQTTSSGILQSLSIFKKTEIWQVIGDTTQANLALNFLSLTIGTQSPRTVVQAPYGIYFVASSGPYFIDLFGAVRAVTNQQQDQQPDLQVPFQNAVTPTRWCGAYSSPIYRVCGPTVIQGVQSVNDYWFDEHKRRWTGPHSFAYDCASALGTTFVLSSALNPGQLIQSSPLPTPGWPVTDLGVAMSFNLQTATFPKVLDMFVRQSVESQIELSAPQGQVTFSIMAQQEVGNVIGGPISVTAGINPPRWGTMIWGAFNWTSSAASFQPQTYSIYWTSPLVFEKMQLNISGTLTAPIGIGTFLTRYEKLGYATTGQQ